MNLTIGQYFYNELRKDEYFRIKENIFPREAYIEEFDTICKQQSYLPQELIDKIRNEITISRYVLQLKHFTYRL